MDGCCKVKWGQNGFYLRCGSKLVESAFNYITDLLTEISGAV